jgi:demethylmacrocin O-methyltransferase
MPALKSWLKAKLGDARLARIKHHLKLYPAFFAGSDLSKLADVHGTDKNFSHFYTQHYQKHFGPLRKRRLRVLEIGIGGYDDPRNGGESLRMWKCFFPNSQIVGIDIHDKHLHDSRRIKTLQGSQDDPAFLEKVHREWGPFDIIVDDGSHQSPHMIRSFEVLFPLLNQGGIYAIEDVQTSYWENFAETGQTAMQFLLGLVNGVNFEEYKDDNYQPTYYDRHIVGMHFYHNLVFIEKGLNNEGSNILGKRFWKV